MKTVMTIQLLFYSKTIGINIVDRELKKYKIHKS